MHGFETEQEAEDFIKNYISPNTGKSRLSVKKYARGTSNAKKGLALTQENGLEAIMTDK